MKDLGFGWFTLEYVRRKTHLACECIFCNEDLGGLFISKMKKVSEILTFYKWTDRHKKKKSVKLMFK